MNIDGKNLNDLHELNLVKEHKGQRPTLPGLPGSVISDSVKDTELTPEEVLERLDQSNEYVTRVPEQAWMTFADFVDAYPAIVEQKEMLIHVDTVNWKVLVHARHTTHPAPKQIRSNPPTPTEYLPLHNVIERLKEWRKLGFDSQYEPTTNRLIGMGISPDQVVFNIGFRYIRLHWTPKGYVWCDSYNTAIPATILEQTVFFPTMKERMAGASKRNANAKSQLSLRYQVAEDGELNSHFGGPAVENIPLIEKDSEEYKIIVAALGSEKSEEFLDAVNSGDSDKVDAMVAEHEAAQEAIDNAQGEAIAQHSNEERSDEELLAEHGEPVMDFANQAEWEAHKALDPLQGFPDQKSLDEHEAWNNTSVSEADLQADGAEVHGNLITPNKYRNQSKAYLVVGTRPENVGQVFGYYTARVAADRNKENVSDEVLTRTQYAAKFKRKYDQDAQKNELTDAFCKRWDITR